MREHRDAVEEAGGRCLAVGFSPAGALAQLAAFLEWPWPFLADEQRRLYARLRVGRAAFREVYSPGTLRRYLAAAARGTRIRRPVEDTRQLGGDALIRHGRVVWMYRQRSPDDRPEAAELIEQLDVQTGNP